MDQQFAGNFVDGAVTRPLSGETRPNIAPATGANLGEAAWSNAQDVERACRAASDAAPGWASLGTDGRRVALRRWAAAIQERADELALADAIDSGTPIRTMRAGVAKGLDYVDYFTGLGFELKGETVPASPGNLHYTIREPFGVVAVIIPFNHPAFFALSKTIPALMAGNTVVLKPAEQTPLVAALLAEASAGILPPGVFNVVQGGPEVGRSLVRHPRTERVHFTGGVTTGLAVQAGAAESGLVKRVTLELGGKNPFIVFPDADPTVAAEAAITGMNFTRNQGQSCGSTSRLFVHAALADEVTERVCDLAGKIQLGLPEEESTQMGSLVSKAHQQRVLGLVREGVDEGAQLLVGGHAPDGELSTGAFVEPTVFSNVKTGMSIAQEEIFGPVLSIIEWSDEQDMLGMVNASSYGLTAAIYTRDISTALRTAAAVESGYIWVNSVETRWKATAFGGYKNSGIGSEHSLEELESYTRVKSVNVVI